MIVDSDGLDLTSVSLPGWSFMPKQGTVRTVLYSTVQYCTVLYTTAQCCTADIHIRISVCGIHGSLAVACGVLGPTPTPKAGANACGGLWRRKICDRRVAAGFGNAIRENYYTHGRCKRLRWPVRFAEERDAGMGGPKVNLTFNPLAKLHPDFTSNFTRFHIISKKSECL